MPARSRRPSASSSTMPRISNAASATLWISSCTVCVGSPLPPPHPHLPRPSAMTDVLTPPTKSPRAKLATEQEAREVAEAAREKEWEAPSFVRELFEGDFRLDLVHPYPELDPKEVEKARPFMERLEAFMRDKVDSDAIDREGQIPPEVVDGLRELGAFGIKIPEEYGGLGLSQTSYTHAIGLVTSTDGNLTALLSVHQS